MRAGATGAGASGAARARAPAAVDADAVANGVLLGADDDARREGAGRATRATSAEGGTTATATATATIGTACRAIAVLACVVAVIGGVVYASTRLEIDLYEDVVPHVKNPVKFFLLNVAVASFGVIPGAASASCVTAGIVFGTLGGMALCVTSASVGAVVSFTLSRYVARPWVEKAFVRDGGRLKALDDAVSKDGSQIVILVRLSPFSPFTVASYMLGLTSVPFVSFCTATTVGLLPSSFVYVYMGDTGRRASGSDGATLMEIVFYVLGLLVTLFVSYRIAVIAQEAMRSKVGTHWDPSTGSDDDDDDTELDVFGSRIEESEDEEVGLVVSANEGGPTRRSTRSVV